MKEIDRHLHNGKNLDNILTYFVYQILQVKRSMFLRGENALAKGRMHQKIYNDWETVRVMAMQAWGKDLQ